MGDGNQEFSTAVALPHKDTLQGNPQEEFSAYDREQTFAKLAEELQQSLMQNPTYMEILTSSYFATGEVPGEILFPSGDYTYSVIVFNMDMAAKKRGDSASPVERSASPFAPFDLYRSIRRRKNRSGEVSPLDLKPHELLDKQRKDPALLNPEVYLGPSI